MKPGTRSRLLLALLLNLPLFAGAQSAGVWRCGPDGRLYSDTPCAEGQALALAGARPQADVQAAQALAAQERRQADKLLNERLQREAAARQMVAGGPAPAAKPVKPVAKPAATHKRQPARPADDGIWRAVAPASRPSRG